MSFFEIFNFSKMPVFFVWLCIFVSLNSVCVLKKKSLYSLISLIFSIVFLIIHIVSKSNFTTSLIRNLIIDFISLIVSIGLYIYVDEIESRRKVISEVFENRYKNRSKK